MATNTSRVTASSPDGQITMDTDQARISLLAGTQRRITLNVTNNAGAPLSLELNSKGLPSNWLALTPTTLRLAPIQTATVTVNLAPPADAPSGDYPLVLSAGVTDHPETSARLNLIFEIAEPGTLAVNIAPSQAEGQVSAEFQVTLQQTGADTLALALAAQDADNACDYTFNPANVTLPPNGVTTSGLVVRARQGLTGLDSRAIAFTVTATATQGAAVTGSGQGRFVQRRGSPLEIKLEPIEQRGAQSAEYSVLLSNSSQIEAQVRLSARALDDGCRFEFTPNALTVPPSGQGKVKLTVTPVKYTSERGDTIHPFVVRAEPAGQLLSPVEVEGRYNQTAGEQLVVTLNPTSQSKAGPATFSVQVKNPRAQAVRVDLRAYDTGGMCTFQLNPAQLQIPANGQAAASLTVRPNAALLPGEPRRTLPFSVEAQAGDMPQPVVVQGNLTAVRGLPIWLLFFLAALILLGVLALIAGLVIRNLTLNHIAPTPTVLIAIVPPTLTAIPTPTSKPVETVAVVNKSLPTYTPLPTYTSLPTYTPFPSNTAAPIDSPIPPPSPTDTLPPPPTTRIPVATKKPQTPTPAFPPGVYVSGLRVDPGAPRNAQDMTFYAIFQNTTGANQGYRWCVELYRVEETKKSFGISPCRQDTIPSGKNELASAPGYRVVGLSGCLPLRAHVIWDDGQSNRIPFLQPDGTPYWFSFQVCP